MRAHHPKKLSYTSQQTIHNVTTSLQINRTLHLRLQAEEDQSKMRRKKDAQKLPLGIAAALAFFGSFGIIIPCMSQVWYVGPIARAGTGDIGIFTGFVSAGMLYLVFRAAELHFLRYDIPRRPAGDGGEER